MFLSTVFESGANLRPRYLFPRPQCQLSERHGAPIITFASGQLSYLIDTKGSVFQIERGHKEQRLMKPVTRKQANDVLRRCSAFIKQHSDQFPSVCEILERNEKMKDLKRKVIG